VATSATVLLLGSLFAGCGSDANVGDAGPLGDSAILADADVADVALDAALDASAPGEPRLADGITLTGVELFQSVEIPLMQGGTASPPGAAPVVAARDAMVRVYAAPTGGAVTVTAEIELGSVGGPTTTLRATQTIDAPSTTADPTSTFNLLVPAASVTPDAQYRVRLVAPDGTPAATGVMHDARYPRDGSTAPLGAQDDMGGVELVLVPVRYNYDGSGRLPDTSAAQLDLFRSLLLAVYPLSQVTITVRDPIDWSDGPQLFTGNFDFGQLNRYLQDLKTTDGAPSASYYYALVQPGPTFSAYCGGSCTTGQSFVVGNPADGDQRVGGGMGYSGERWAWTLAHELGHMHGRSHAPCNVGSSDPSYPYGGGAIGVWGYDPRADAYFDPSTVTDMMGYCDDRWISDYNYGAIFDRILSVHRLAVSTPPSAPRPSTRTVCTSYSTPSGPSCECVPESREGSRGGRRACPERPCSWPGLHASPRCAPRCSSCATGLPRDPCASGPGAGAPG